MLSRERLLKSESVGHDFDGHETNMTGSEEAQGDMCRMQGCHAKLNVMMVEWNPAEPGVASRLGIFHMEEKYWMLQNSE